MNTARAARPLARNVVVHFWPGTDDPNNQPGAILPCKGPFPRAALTTRFFRDVTCKRCRSSRVFRVMAEEFATAAGCTMKRPALVEWGFLPKDAPPPIPPPKPYRNPNLSRDPLENVIVGWEELAAGNPATAAELVAGALTPEERKAYSQCAHQLRQVLAAMKGGGL